MKKVFLEIWKVHRKTPVPESLLNRVASTAAGGTPLVAASDLPRFCFMKMRRVHFTLWKIKSSSGTKRSSNIVRYFHPELFILIRYVNFSPCLYSDNPLETN